MVSLGEELKREREFREISLREISDATKINIRILQAIENDDYTNLPGGIFNRNFIRAYAQFIGLDPEIAVRKYLVQTSEPSSEQRYPPSIISPSAKDRVSKRPMQFYFLLAVIVAVVLLLVAWFYRSEIPFLQKSVSNLSWRGGKFPSLRVLDAWS